MLFLCFRRVNTKSSNHQSSSSSSSSSLSSCSSSSALAHELVQATVTETDTSSQLDWTYDPNEPRYCICNQVHFPQPSKIQSTNDSVSSPFPLLWSACMCLQSHTHLYQNGTMNTKYIKHIIMKRKVFATRS